MCVCVCVCVWWECTQEEHVHINKGVNEGANGERETDVRRLQQRTKEKRSLSFSKRERQTSYSMAVMYGHTLTLRVVPLGFSTA